MSPFTVGVEFVPGLAADTVEASWFDFTGTLYNHVTDLWLTACVAERHNGECQVTERYDNHGRCGAVLSRKEL